MYLVKVITPGRAEPKAKTIGVSEIDPRTRFEHCHIMASSGWGKTQLLESMILNDLKQSPSKMPGVVVIDSQGQMLERIARLALFEPERGALRDRLIIIDPTDVDHLPAMNPFAIDRKRLGGYDARARAEVLNGTVALYGYIFESLLDAKSTQRQKMVLGYMTRLLLCIPDARLDTLRELLADHTAHFARHSAELDAGTVAFFAQEYSKKDYRRVGNEIARRLWGLMEDPTLGAMIGAKERKIDLHAALDAGKVVLINTALGFLKGERSSLLGRLFIALVQQAVLERAGQASPRAAHVYIDEAQEYFDEQSIGDALRQFRKYRAGLTLAHQDLAQLGSPALRSAMITNTAIKLVGGCSDRDARALAADMKTTPDFLTSQRKAAKGSSFAAFVRGKTTAAVSLPVTFGLLDREPQMSDRMYSELLARNRRAVAG